MRFRFLAAHPARRMVLRELPSEGKGTMTLSTDMLVLDPTDVEALYSEANRLVAAGIEVRVNRAAGEIHNAPGQGLPAWLEVTYGIDGPLDVELDADEVEEDGTPYQRWPQPHAIRINWDTSYTYRDSQGRTCDDLHAAYIVTLGRWLDERGVRWCWHNEYTGEWFDGATGLETLSEAGAKAQDWFQSMALPGSRAWRYQPSQRTSLGSSRDPQPDQQGALPGRSRHAERPGSPAQRSDRQREASGEQDVADRSGSGVREGHEEVGTMRLFHRIDVDDKLKPVYIRTSDIQAVVPASETGCSVYVRDGLHFQIAETAEEVLEACGYNATPEPDGLSVGDLAVVLRNELGEAWSSAKRERGPAEIARAEGHMAGLQRALELLGYAES
jgi:hypothetical protein